MRTGPENAAATSAKYDAWAIQNEHWLASKKKPSPVARRNRPTEPLVLCGHGVTLNVERDTLLIRNGLTHFPQERETFRFFKGDLTLPPKIIMLDGSGSLSFDVISWLSAQGVPLVRIGWQGDVVSIIGGGGAAYDPERIAWQVQTRADPESRMAFCVDLTLQKLGSTLTTLRTTIPDSAGRRHAIAKAESAIDRLTRVTPSSVGELMLAEARAAAAYFQAWRALPLRWKRLKTHPIPDHWLTPTTRRSDYMRLHSTNRHATHPVNAMLNYAYAVLHSQVQIEAVAAGYDPTRGIMHESRPDSRALVLDLMEPRRPVVDAAVLKFVSKEFLSGADFVIRGDGVCRLSPQLAKRLVFEIR